MNRKNRSSGRGTATLEATLVLLTLTAIWMGVVHLGGKAVDQVMVRAKARECAWRIAMSGCDEVPPSCKAAVGEGSGSNKSHSLEESGRDASTGGRVAKAFQQILMKQIKTLFSERVEVTASSQERTSPELFLGTNTQEKAGYQLPCNTKPVDLGELAQDAFRSLQGKK